jgi:tetratricopeptide (TPR) repeat protein
VENSCNKENDIESIKKEAFEHRIKDEPSKALEKLDKAISINPYDTQALYQKAEVLSSIGKDEEGLEVAEQGLRADPDETRLLHYKMTILEKLGYFISAKTVAREIQNSNPVDCAQWIAKGNALSKLNRYNEACDAFKKAEELDFEFANSSLIRANHHERYGEYKQALNISDNALKVWNDHEVYSYRATIFQKMGSLKRAQKEINAALSIRDDIALYWRKKSDIQESRGHLKGALYSYIDMINLDGAGEKDVQHLAELLYKAPNPMVKKSATIPVALSCDHGIWYR